MPVAETARHPSPGLGRSPKLPCYAPRYDSARFGALVSLQKPLADTERGQLEILQERGQEILELIEGLTVLSGLQAGGLKLAKASTDVTVVVQRVVRALLSRAAAKGTCYQRDREVVMTVADDGIGFTPEEQGRILRPFSPVGPRNGRNLPGTGLLLTVAERLVIALGGKIKIESELDRGSWVTVTLPVQG